MSVLCKRQGKVFGMSLGPDHSEVRTIELAMTTTTTTTETWAKYLRLEAARCSRSSSRRRTGLRLLRLQIDCSNDNIAFSTYSYRHLDVGILSPSYAVGRAPWMGGQPVARPLPNHRINAHRHPCLEWDYNQGSQCLKGRIRFVSLTARPLWSALVTPKVFTLLSVWLIYRICG
jgi:hypothetical protein